MFDFETISGTLVPECLINRHVLVSAAAMTASNNDGGMAGDVTSHGACVGIEKVLAAAVLLGDRCDASIAHT